LAGGAAAIVATYLKPLIFRTYKPTARWDIGTCCNGILVGCVSVTGACDRIENWAAVVIGVVGAFVYIGACKFLEKAGIDDPVEASAVHGAGGIWGLIAVAFFDNTTGIVYPIETRGSFLAYQLAGVFAISAWTIAMSIIFFGIVRLLKLHRVPLSVEIMGYDIVDHGSLSKRFLHKIKLEQAVEDMMDQGVSARILKSKKETAQLSE
jgi:Amt family ammonium transporter